MKKFAFTNLMLALSVSAYAITPFKVENVVINGVNPNQMSALQALIDVKQGTQINDAKVKEVITKLYATGNFNNVIVDKVNNNLVIDVKFKEVIATVNFEGNNLLPTEQIRKSFDDNNVRTGAPFNEDRITALTEEIEKFYQSQGYNHVEVSSAYDKLADGTVNVRILIDEKKKSYLKDLQVTGNNTFTVDQLLTDSLVRPDTKWYNFYHNSNFNAQGVATLNDAIKNYYLEKGYAKFKVNSSKQEYLDAENPQNVTYKLDLTEGDVYKFGNFSVFTRNNEFNESVAKFSSINSGDLFKQSRVDATVSSVKAYLAGLGYARAIVEPVFKYNDETKTVDVILAIDPGSRFTVNSITFTGNYLTKDYVLRRMLRQQENATFNSNLVDADKSALLRTGFFSDVDSSYAPVAQSSDLLDLTYKVTETPNGSFNIGVGYGDVQGLTFTTKFSQSNFLGTGRTVALELTKSAGRFVSSLDYTEPYITNYGLSLNGSIYYSYTDTSKLSSYSGSDYKQEVYGLSVGTSIPVSLYGRLSGSVSFENNKYYNLTPEWYRGLYLASIGQLKQGEEWKINTKNTTFSLSYNWNNYDRYLFPTKGTDFTASASYTGLFSTDKYLSTGLSLRNYQPLNDSRSFILSSRANASKVFTAGSKYLPISALYSAGGFGTLRGYSYGSVGPVPINCSVSSVYCSVDHPEYFTRVNTGSTIGGDVLVSGGLDLIFPLFRGEAAKTVRTSAFIDTAAVWSTSWNDYTKNLDPKVLAGLENYAKPNFRYSYGLNLDWQSPLGLLSFSVAKPINKQAGDNTELFSINFGTTF